MTCFGVLISQLDVDGVCVSTFRFPGETLLKYLLHGSLHVFTPVLRSQNSSTTELAWTSKDSVADGVVLTYGVVDLHAYS